MYNRSFDNIYQYHKWKREYRPTGHFYVYIRRTREPRVDFGSYFAECRLQNGLFHSLETYAFWIKETNNNTISQPKFCIYGQEYKLTDWLLHCNLTPEKKALILLEFG